MATTAALGALLLVVGPIVIILPKLAAGLLIVKGAMETLYLRALYLKGALPGMALLFGKIALAAGAFIAGWQFGRLIAETLGLDKAIQGLYDRVSLTLEQHEKLSRVKMGFTDKAKHALFLRDTMMDLAKSLNPEVNNMRSAARAIRENEEAYNNLHPRLKRIVDGFTAFRTVTASVVTELKSASEELNIAKNAVNNFYDKVLGMSAKNVDAIIAVQETAKIRIEELTLSTTEFKIRQANREHERNLQILRENNASREFLRFNIRQHHLEIQKIRDEAYRIQQEKEKKRTEEERKAKEKEKKAKEKELKKEEERQRRHFDFLEDLKKEQQALVLQRIEERNGWRVAELARLDIWHSDQFKQLEFRLKDEIITFDEYQIQKTAILETGEMKSEQIENEARKREEKAEKEKEERLWSNFESITSKKQALFDKYFGFITNLNTVYTALRESQLNSWYDQEYARIMASSMSNEERSLAIEALDAQMHAKKAALEAQAQKRERAMAIAQAIANTAVAITTALKALPWPFNLPAIAFAIATGAAQIAAIGGAYKAPGLESFAPGGGEAGEGGAGGGGEVGAGRVGREVAAFQTGTQRYITPPREFLVGEPYSTERIQLRGPLRGVGMSVTPLGQTAPVQSGTNIHLDFSGMHIIDATDFENRVRDFLPRLMQQLFDNGIIYIPRGRVR
jgi:hypothetical protein